MNTEGTLGWEHGAEAHKKCLLWDSDIRHCIKAQHTCPIVSVCDSLESTLFCENRNCYGTGYFWHGKWNFRGNPTSMWSQSPELKIVWLGDIYQYLRNQNPRPFSLLPCLKTGESFAIIWSPNLAWPHSGSRSFPPRWILRLHFVSCVSWYLFPMQTSWTLEGLQSPENQEASIEKGCFTRTKMYRDTYKNYI